jgi:hypothetical protein
MYTNSFMVTNWAPWINLPIPLFPAPQYPFVQRSTSISPVVENVERQVTLLRRPPFQVDSISNHRFEFLSMPGISVCTVPSNLYFHCWPPFSYWEEGSSVHVLKFWKMATRTERTREFKEQTSIKHVNIFTYLEHIAFSSSLVTCRYILTKD